MVKKVEYDFLSWTSFPSSLKITNDEPVRWPRPLFEGVTVKPNATLKVELTAKTKNVQNLLGYGSFLYFLGWDGGPAGYQPFHTAEKPTNVPVKPGLLGTSDWTKYTHSFSVPPTVVLLAGDLINSTGITWWEDLKIYQDDVLIYSNDFSNWDPAIGIGVGAPIGGAIGYFLKEPLGPMVSEAVGAILGGALGGGVGLLTGLGIISVPQIPIPTFGAAPEGPGAPARLGKYQITG